MHRSGLRLVGVCVLAGLVGHGEVRAQSPADIAEGAAEADSGGDDPGQQHIAYAGGVPGASGANARRQPPSAGHCRVTWHGFQPLSNGGSRLFLQMTTEVTYAVETQAGRLVVTLPGCRVVGRNSLRPLETHFFNSPVQRARLASTGAGSALVIELRADAAPSVRQEQAAAGRFFLYIDFPPGDYPTPVQPATETSAPAVARGCPRFRSSIAKQLS